MNTSTPEGRARRLRVLQEKDEKKYIINLKKKYKETGNKSYAWTLHEITGGGDNLPGPDSDPS